NGVSVTRLPFRYGRNGKFDYVFCYGAFLFLVGALLGWRCLSRRYHLVHVHNMPDFLVFSSLIPKLFGARVLLDLHDPMPELCETIFGVASDHRMVRWLKILERWSLAYADLAVTPNTAFRDVFVSRG